MNYIKQNDLLMGDMNEELIQIEFKDKFNIDLTKSSKFDIMDYTDESNNIYVEIKSRNFKYNKYPTTMIGLNKLEFAKDCKKVCYFIFSFTDGNYYYKYDSKDSFDVKYTGRTDRGYIEYKKHCFIPIYKLKNLNSLYDV